MLSLCVSSHHPKKSYLTNLTTPVNSAMSKREKNELKKRLIGGGTLMGDAEFSELMLTFFRLTKSYRGATER